MAPNYDQMNDLMSGGLHRLWKDDLVAMLNPPRGTRSFQVLDRRGRHRRHRLPHRQGRRRRRPAVTVADISPEMLAEGRRRASAGSGWRERCRFVVANAEALAFRDRSFDAYTIAFGIRNVTDIEPGAERSLSRAEAGRSVSLPRILACRCAGLRSAL